jgi:hypothetical protein
VVLVGTVRAVAAPRWSAAVPVEDHDGGVVAEVAAGGAQDRGAERVDHFAGMQVAGLAEGGGDIEFRVSAIMKFPRLEVFAIT